MPTATTTTPSTTPTYTYRAQTDAGTKHWHLGAVEGDAKCFCGTLLMTAGDTRKFALKVPEAERQYRVSDQLDRVDCRACIRNREWGYANGLPRPAPATPRGPRAARNAPLPTDAQYPAVPGARVADEHELARDIRRRRPQHARTLEATEAAALAADAAARTAETAAAPSTRRRRTPAATPAAEAPAVGSTRAPRRQSRASRSAELAREATARREALAADATASVDAIDAALAAAEVPAAEADCTLAVEAADAGLAVIAAAIAETTGEAPLLPAETPAPARRRAARPSRASRAAALVDAGLADSPADARAQLADMGE